MSDGYQFEELSSLPAKACSATIMNRYSSGALLHMISTKLLLPQGREEAEASHAFGSLISLLGHMQIQQVYSRYNSLAPGCCPASLAALL